MDELELTELFRKLGARDPAGWARSQLDAGIPQLARYLFLRQAWRLVVRDKDPSWIDDLGQIDTQAPGGQLGPAIDRLVSAGASRDDLTTIVRVMQWRLLAGLCYLLDDPGDLEPEVENIAWSLFQIDEDGCPINGIGGLIESVLETDPTGRAMRQF
jgi:hypothetical protein